MGHMISIWVLPIVVAAAVQFVHTSSAHSVGAAVGVSVLILLIKTAYSCLREKYKKYLVVDGDCDTLTRKPMTNFDRRRFLTYSGLHPVPNTWYHLCDSEEIVYGEVKEFRVLGRSYVVWRTRAGQVVVQDAFCLHLGANLGVGGTVENDCIVCPFHRWEFDSEGNIARIPYVGDKERSDKICSGLKKKLETHHSVEYCGLICVYFHADGEPPAFQLPSFVPRDLENESWAPHLKLDIGFLPLSVVDWVDQAGDHAHFHTLHNEFVIPWTKLPVPAWILKLFPIGICHELVTHRGDDPAWAKIHAETGRGSLDKHLIFFTDKAGLTWKGKPMPSTLSETLEMYMGPAMMCFHIPFTIGTFKVFVNTTPCDGGSIMKVRTWIDKRTQDSLFKRGIAWLLAGLSASQLAADITILTNKVRPKRPMIVPDDGPFNRTTAWLKMFYSESSGQVGEGGFKNDW
jgi:nitrite reductase/ring-hydroxylating ferredoxin subunit